MVKVVTPAASSPIHQCTAALSSVHCSTVQCTAVCQKPGAGIRGVHPVSTGTIWMRTGTSPCTGLSPSPGGGHTY